MLWIELRNSPIRWWFPLFLVTDVVMLFGRQSWWIGVWPQASAAAQLAGHSFGALLAAAAAWNAGREHRGEVTELLSAAARARWQADALQLTSTLLYGGVPYIVGALIAAVVSYEEAGPGFLWPGYLILGASVLIMGAALGHLAGKLFTARFMPTIAVATLMFAISLTGVEMVVLSGMPQLTFSPQALAARLLLAVLLVLIAVAVPGRTPERTGNRSAGRPAVASRLLLPAAALAVAVGVAGVVYAGPLRIARPAPEAALCSTGSPRVCLWPENRKYLPEISAMATRLAASADLIKLPEVFYERGLRGDDRLSGFLILEGASSVPDSMAGSVLEHTMPRCDVPESATSSYLHELWSIGQWLAVRAQGSRFPASMAGGPPGVDMEEIYQVAQRPEDEQAAWFRSRMKAIAEIEPSCA
jgi:hypothetical protein